MSPNPFTPMLLTYNPRRFYGRQKEIAGMLQVITAPDPGGHAIYGIRTIGKTTLLKFLRDRNGALKQHEQFVNAEYRIGGAKRLLFVYLNFHIFADGESVFYLMLAQLDEELQDDPLAADIAIPQFDDESPKHEVVGLLRRTLQKLGNRAVRVVFLLDDFDPPLRMIEPQDDGLLRTICDYAALIIATELPISELRPDIGAASPLLGILRPEAVGLITDSAARDLICEPTKDTAHPISTDEADFLMQIAGRQPFLLTAACELYFEQRSEYPEIATQITEQPTRTHLQAQFLFRLNGQLHVNRVLQNTWNKLRPLEQRALYDSAVGQSFDYNSDLGKTAARLANFGLVYWDFKHEVYRVASLLFADFARSSYIIHADKPIVDLIPPTTDGLTPIDSALLRYLTLNADRVCTFDELLDAIWSDGEKSKRALEAAVFRLRKLLKSDEHIKNIRGKGYRFIRDGRLTPETL